MVDQSIKLISVPSISSDCSSFNLTEWSKHKLANSHACGVRYSLSPSVSCSHAAQTLLTPKQQQTSRYYGYSFKSRYLGSRYPPQFSAVTMLTG